MNYIGTMIGMLGESQYIYEKDSRRLNKYLKNMHLPNKTKQKVKEHFYNKHQIEETYDADSEPFLFEKMTE